MRFSTKLLGVLSASTLCALPAQAQTVDRIIAFGDSYADDGNFFELTGIPVPAVYPNGRFSNGTNFIDTMAMLLGVPVDNFAIGGAFTGPGNTGFTNINGPGIPGFPTEVQSYLAGGGPAAFPRVDGQFDEDDLVVVSIGGNDARYYQFSGGTVAGAPDAAAISVAEATAGLNALVDAGAQNITFLAGDVGQLPEVRGTPIAAVGSAFASSFNSGIQASLADIASEGIIVNYLDLTLIGQVVEKNLAEFGLTSAGACPIACVTTNPELLSQYLFYVDRVHLTSAGFAIVGRYAVRQLEAPLHFQAQGDVGLETARAFGSTMLGRLDLSGVRSGDRMSGLNFYVTASTASHDRGRTDTNLPYDLDVFGITAGAEFSAGPGALFGIAVNHSRPEAEITTGTGQADAKAWQLGIYGGWSGGGGFAEAYAGYGWLDYDIEREAVIDTIHGETDGTATTAGAKAGFLFGSEGLRFGPVLSVQYAKAEIDAYTETGDPVLTLNVGEQEASALTGSAGVEARAVVDMGGLAVRPYAALMAEKDFEGDSRSLLYSGTASPIIVNTWNMPEQSDDIYARFTAGASFALGGTAALEVNGSSSFGREGGEDLFAMAGLKLGF